MNKRHAILILLLAGVAVGAWALRRATAATASAAPASESAAARPAPAPAPAAPGPRAKYPVTIRRPDSPPTVQTDLVGHDGKAVAVACGTCHATRAPNPQNQATEDLDLFHQGLAIRHGGLTCVSCHNATDYDALRKADGTRVDFPDVMSLCAQCHGPQFRDYQHGAHGGMNGYWDLSRGPRTRNNCIQCHDPHTPAYQVVRPAPGPRDRFLTPPTHAKESLPHR